MINYAQPGEVLKLTAPTGSPGGVVSGQPYLIGSLLVIAMESKDGGELFDAQVTGVYLGTKGPNEAWTEGQVVRWNNTDRIFTEVVGSPANPIVGSAAYAVPVAIVLANDSANSPQDLSVADNVLTVGDYTGLGDVVLTITVARDHLAAVTYTLTEGVDFDAETGNEETADNIAAAINLIPGLAAVASTVAGSPPTELVTVTADSPVRGAVRLDGVAR